MDVGERRIGLAVGDTESRLAVPAGAIERRETAEDIDQVLTAAASRNVDTLVVGMPWSLSGHAGPQAQHTLAFVETMRQHTSLPVETWDERFTSVDADQRLRQAQPQGRGRGAKPSGGVQDAMAATIMLQAYLDAHSRS